MIFRSDFSDDVDIRYWEEVLIEDKIKFIFCGFLVECVNIDVTLFDFESLSFTGIVGL